MRNKLFLSGATLALASLVAAPIAAQEAEEKSGTRQVLGRILDAVLGPDEVEEEAAAEESVTDAADEAAEDAVVAPTLDEVLAHERRDEDRARDVWRHPAATLQFFQVEPGQSVVEYAPGGGWYTRILAPYLTPTGQYTAINFAPGAASSLGENFVERVRAAGRSFSQTQSEALGIPAEDLPFYWGTAVPEELNGTVDRVLVIRMMHNLKRWGIADTELMMIRRILKEDGLVGIVQHQAPEDMSYAMTDGNRGYLKRSDLIALMDAYGFELVSESTINRNPRDTATWEGGVWQLPPTWASKDEGLKAVGESNRMTLLFRKAS